MHVQPLTRSAFLLRSSLAAAAAWGASAAGPWTSRVGAQESDVDVLDYLLTVEHVQSEFYARGLEEVAGLGEEQRALVQELRDNEQEHVDALTATIEQLGGAPGEPPSLDFGDAYSGVEAFLRQANILEDTGVSAYNGAAPDIQAREVLAAVAGIVQVEGRHAALVRLQRDVPPAPLAFDKASTRDEVLEALQPFIQS